MCEVMVVGSNSERKSLRTPTKSSCYQGTTTAHLASTCMYIAYCSCGRGEREREREGGREILDMS